MKFGLESYLINFSISEITYSLQNNANMKREGRLEVRYNYRTGAVCNRNWNEATFNLVCNTFGFQNGGEFIDRHKRTNS